MDSGTESVWISESADYAQIGPWPYIRRLAQEYGIPLKTLYAMARFEDAYISIGSQDYTRRYYVPKKILRQHGDFTGAGDAEALEYCEEIVDELVSRYGKTRDEAVTAINRMWLGAGNTGRNTQGWMVGLDLTYHELPERYAEIIHDRFG